ncbi:MAG: tetratricopeptide repeat protein [Methylotenera sp.]
MIKKLCLSITVVSFIGCTGNPTVSSIKPFDKQRVYDIPGDKIIDQLGKALPNFLLSTSSTATKLNVERDETGVGLIITQYKPKDDSFTECYVPNGGGLMNRKNGLNYGIIAIVLTPGQKGTTVQIKSTFNENRSVEVPGKVIGHVSTAYGGGTLRGPNETANIGSSCYSTGIIERSIFDMIQTKTSGAGKADASLDEALVADDSFWFLPEYQKRYMESARGKGEAHFKDLVKSIMKPKYDFNFSANDANSLGMMYAEGVMVPKNYATAFKLFEKGATTRSVGQSDGTVACSHNLGFMYEKGIGTAKNDTKALDLYQQTQNYARGQNKLGYLYAKGLLGLKKDEAKAAKLFTQVVAEGQGRDDKSYFIALRNLGYMYANGLGAKKNDVAAYTCYRKVALGDSDAKAQKAADVIRARMTDKQIQETNEFLKGDEYFANKYFNAYLEKSLYL